MLLKRLSPKPQKGNQMKYILIILSILLPTSHNTVYSSQNLDAIVVWDGALWNRKS